MKKIALSIIALSTIVFFACEEKSTTNPSSTTTTGGGTTGATYYISANINGVNKQFTNLTVYRDETPGSISLLIVANNLSSEKPSIEFNLRQPSSGWADNLSYALNIEQNSSYVKYTTETGRVYSSSNVLVDETPYKIDFSKFNFVKGGSVVGAMNGKLFIDLDTTSISITNGKLNLVCEN